MRPGLRSEDREKSGVRGGPVEFPGFRRAQRVPHLQEGLNLLHWLFPKKTRHPKAAHQPSAERLAKLKSWAKETGLKGVDWGLLDQALTHRSFAHERASGGGAYADNERLEFFGDSVLGLVVSDRLFAKHPEASEGELSRVRGAAVSQDSLATVASGMGLGPLINLGRGEIHAGGDRRPSILSSALEAVIAAVYLSSGLKNAESFIKKHLEPTLEGVKQGTTGRDYKSLLQEETQRRWKDTPHYEIIAARGPEHRRLFECNVHSGGRELGSGRGKSKKEAEQRAAESALGRLTKH